MPAGSSSKRERQYEHIKESYEKRGQKGRAEEIAARTVNKERAEAGETKAARKGGSKSASKSGKKSSSRSAGKSGSSRASASSGERTRAQLYEEAKRRDISGRSAMNKAQLERALSR
ncbi:MAG TPA: plasmid stabilization protein [Ramlibacter sp.]|jgi:activator of HSP90 ATPase|nr:plasmid stabilization protein [Ramlibacter sp.]